MFWNTYVSGHGFGLNTDIFDTNVINLAIVLLVIISVGGNALRETLASRKQTILDNLAVVEQREEEAKKNLHKAKTELAEAEEECRRLRRSGETAKAAGVDEINQAGEQKLRALKRGTDSAIRSERLRLWNDLADHLIGASLERADRILRRRAKSGRFYDWVMDYKIRAELDLHKYKELFQPRSKNKSKNKPT